MGGYFDRGASASGQDEGYFNRDDVTDPEGVGSATGGPGGVAKDDIEFDSENPNIARAVRHATPGGDETVGNTTGERRGTYPDVIEGSDSERTGTSWGLSGVEEAPTVSTPSGEMPEGDKPGEASPNRNTGDRLTRDDLNDVGSWSTMDKEGSGGSPSGNS